ncbi:hypothetical protein HY256_09305, partial [Candidatus Sumerlaeota bacterium]|nr:hypothetical protein [Candidatus Sumerlaeota bacterium]
AAVLAGVGLYVNLRYLIPALSGLPFLHHYMGVKPEAGLEESSGSG